MELFRVRLNCVDHYQIRPTPFDPELRRNVSPSQRQHEPKVPVIRAFGSTETGQKVCAHIHGAFPYLYIEYGGSLDPDEVGAFIYQLHLSIDHALGVSYRRNVYDGKNQYVARITIVKGIPFYGYYVGFQYFLKIYMYNPMVMTRLSDLLRQGVIMKKIFQPYEAHLQYVLQWMTDYNLYGCGYINCQKVYFRSPVPKYEDLDSMFHLWHDRSIPKDYVLAEGVLPRVSHCSIEVDICVQDISNRKEIKHRPLHHDFIERLNSISPAEKLVHSMAGLWRDETRRRKSRMVDPDPGSSPFPPEVLISMSADVRNSQRGGWIHEEEYMDKVYELIEEERRGGDDVNISFDNFVKPALHGDAIQTALEAVEDLYPENLRRTLGLMPLEADTDTNESVSNEDIEVDLNRIFNFTTTEDENDNFPYDSDSDAVLETEPPKVEKDSILENDQIYLPDVGVLDHETASQPGVEFLKPLYSGPVNPHSFTDTGKPSEGNAVCRLTAEDELQSGNRVSIGCVPSQNLQDGTSSTENGALSTISITKAAKRLKPSIGKSDFYNKRQKVENERLDLLDSELLRNERQGEADVRSVLSIASDVVNKKIQISTSSTSSVVNSVLHHATTTMLQRKSSHESLKPNGRLTTKALNFPVVKDPQDPNTILRLSQGSSQKSNTMFLEKEVSSGSLPSMSPEANKSSSLGHSSVDSIASNQSIVLGKVLGNTLRLYSIAASLKLFAFGGKPPSAQEVTSTMHEYDLPSAIYQDAYYSHESDVPERSREWAGREFRLGSSTIPFLPDFDSTGSSKANFGEKSRTIVDKVREQAMYQKRRVLCGLRSWQIGEPPPTSKDVVDWVRAKMVDSSIIQDRHTRAESTDQLANDELSQIQGPSQKNKHGFKYTQRQKGTSVKHEAQYMSTMSLEVHINTRGNFVPNPEEDEVQCIFWSVQPDEDGIYGSEVLTETHVGIIVLSNDGNVARKVEREMPVEVHQEGSELDLMVRMVEIVRSHDPDILTGYEVHGGSWGYLIERARLKYDYNLCDEFSRMKSLSHGRFGKDNDKWGFNNTSTIHVTGRHMINIWRAMRSELNLLQYTMENVAFHLLHRRIPHYSWRDLTTWYSNGRLRDLAKVLNYYVSRVQLDLEILEKNELIPRTSEQARLLGVDFFSVFSRGSQFKVESLMFRIAKPENFILISPSRKQVGGQNALECLPLVMEPQSAFYNSPLLVLDFQSLYPSVMIAYNYCYSTFLGRIVNWRGTNKMGFTDYKRQNRLLELLQDHINIAPNGMMYVKPLIRKSLLAKMLGEILETRVMVKSGMGVDKDDKTLQMLLNNRQLALKLIANVTYGYTSASFSGRMPCSEIADSIVQTARETLEKAIALIHSVKRWGAEVVYGDTDSLFVYLKGRTKDQAFDIGKEIAEIVTNMNPRPVKLKFEKVYFPCVLLAKKRYVGFKYETRDQEEPEFDAKGIETVRRDGTPAEQKIEEKALKILFQSADLSKVKSYFQKQCEKIMKGSISIQDFCFAREVKLGTYSEKGLPPPGALISTRRMLEDARAEPQYGERVPYVVVTGAPGSRLIDRCVSPETLLSSDYMELDSEYYISKNIIPPLERIFNLVGANVRTWYDEMPKVQRIRKVDVNLQALGKSNQHLTTKKTLESYMKSSSCVVCRERLESKDSICAKCLENRPTSLLTLHSRLGNAEKKSQDLEKVCRSCSGMPWLDEIKCDSKDCPVFYSRTRQKAILKAEKAVVGPIMEVLEGRGMSKNEMDW